MIEKFRTAGHVGQTSLDAVIPEEAISPVQRVINTQTNTTAGYLFHDVEHNESIEDIIISNGFLCNGGIKPYRSWQFYEQNVQDNPQKWFLPSGPLAVELYCRTSPTTSDLAKNVRTILHTSFERWSILGSTIEYLNDTAIIKHYNKEEPVVEQLIETMITLTSNNSASVNKFLRALLGKQYATAIQMLRMDYPSVFLDTQIGEWRMNDVQKHGLVLGIFGDGPLGIDADDDGFDAPAIGVTLAKNLLCSPRYEVRDE